MYVILRCQNLPYATCSNSHAFVVALRVGAVSQAFHGDPLVNYSWTALGVNSCTTEFCIAHEFIECGARRISRVV